jgi:RND family efflux transporter MFP subunit
MAQDKSVPQISPVVVSEVVERELASGQTLVGTVMPARRSVIGSAVDGRVVDYGIKRGDAVTAKQPLAKLRTDQLEISLRAAKAELATRQASLEELKNGAREEEIAQSAGELGAAAAVRASTKSRYDRARKLYAQKAMNDEQFQDAAAAYEGARARHAAAQAKYNLMKNGTRPEQIAAAAARLAFQAEQVKLIEEQIARHTVVAPFAGYISQEHSQIGQWVSRGDPIVEVIELADVEVEVFVLEKYLANLRIGSQVQVVVPAVPSSFFAGNIASIVPQADLRSRSFPVRVRVKNVIENAGPVLKAGMLARVQMPLGERGVKLLVDKDAVVLGGREPLVYVLNKRVPVSGQTSVKRVPVQLGVMDESLIQVSGRLQPGDQVVIRGNERLTDKQEVRVSEIRLSPRVSAAAKPAAKAPAASSKQKNGLGS